MPNVSFLVQFYLFNKEFAQNPAALGKYVAKCTKS